MLKTVDLIKDLDEKYHEMVSQVNIPDFTKCVAQFSGIKVSDIKDEVIAKYLKIWAENKYNFWLMLGKATKKDTAFKYNKFRDDIAEEVKTLSREYPVYGPWLREFKGCKTNKIISFNDFGYDFRSWLDNFFAFRPTLEGTTITHFFKSKLNAPDDLVTKIGRIFENDKIESTFTLSIDPVDIMLASDNPYDWTSCYRLELNRDDSHADGCMAAMLDTTSLITYVWDNEGKFDLYNSYKFKSVRYKRMRAWIAIAHDFKSFHFNRMYPGGRDYSEDFIKQLRTIIEEIICNYTKAENKWKHNEGEVDCWREYPYGYSEYDEDNIWVLSSACKKNERGWPCIEGDNTISVFNVNIPCPCGCGGYLPGSYSDDDCDTDEEMKYDGNGFKCSAYHTRFWCDYCDDWCDTECCEEDCVGCSYWDNEHPVCSLDNETSCEDPDWTVDEGVMEATEEHCKHCSKWKECHPENKKKENKEEETLVRTFANTTPWIKVSTEDLGIASVNWSKSMQIALDEAAEAQRQKEFEEQYRRYVLGSMGWRKRRSVEILTGIPQKGV